MASEIEDEYGSLGINVLALKYKRFFLLKKEYNKFEDDVKRATLENLLTDETKSWQWKYDHFVTILGAVRKIFYQVSKAV